MAEDEKQLLSFCTASVELYARSIVDPGTVSAESVQKEIQSFASKMDKTKAANVGKILFSLELQYRNASVYERFLTAKKKIEDITESVQTAVQALEGAGDNLLPIAELQNHSNQHADLVNFAENFLKYYKSCFPIRHRVRYAPIRLTLSPICSYKTDEFEISAAEEYLLLEKQKLLWKVQARNKENPSTGTGPEILVPSVFFFVHWLPDDAETIQRLLGRSRDALNTYILAFSAKFQKVAQQSQFSALFSGAQLKELNNRLSKLSNNPSPLTKEIITTLQDEISTYLQRTEYPDLPEQEKLIVTALSCILSAAKAHLSLPDTIPDRSQVVFNRRLRIDAQKENRAEADKLVHVEWKMELMLNKCITTTETTEIIPKHVDVDRFKQSEQELERKMVIQAVVDPESDTEISLSDALQRGIVDYASGTYINKTETITIDEAIMKGLILVEFVAVQAGEEKLKSYGVVTVKDPATNTEEHYVVHVAVDRKTSERLDFDKAVERKIISLENGWYWDSIENEALPISDALEKGYLRGRKVDNPNDVTDLAKTQADIVKMRLKKVTATMGVLKGFRRSAAAHSVEAASNGTNGTNGTNGH